MLEQALAEVAGIEHAFIYGSWAATYQGQEGAATHDVDVLVVGAPDPDDPFLRHVKSRPRLPQADEL